MRKILLNKNRGSGSVNQTNYIPVEINRDMSLFHDDIMTETVDTTKLYNEEKDASTKHRFIFTIYPLCTNVLYNKISEIVYKEGSDEAEIITDSKSKKYLELIKVNKDDAVYPISRAGVTRLQCIRNTEYSNNMFNLNYHCGLDIFNNHLLRTKEDITVQKKYKDVDKIIPKIVNNDGKIITSSSSIGYLEDAFNTIADVNRTFNGETTTIQMPNAGKHYIYKGGNSISQPLYIYDTIDTFDEACESKLKRKDGWVGFINPTSFQIPIKKDGSNEYYINKCINNKKPCEFIDFTPERDLFSFTPKKNPYRQRLEYNWDYCLTYPYSSYYGDESDPILHGKNKGIALIEKVTGTSSDEYIAANGLEMIRFYTPIKHNLKSGDSIVLKYKITTTTTNELGINYSHYTYGNFKSTVANTNTTVKKYKDRCFSIQKSDLETLQALYPEMTYDNKVINLKITGVAKVVNGFECEYYYRKFKKINANAHSSINRLAFSNTIYGDDITQIVYTDDIDIKNYKDNRGRPLSEIYLTIIKANRGHDKWYKEPEPGIETKPEPNLSNVEYSHVFGKVTSGLDLADFITDTSFPNIRRQHNIDVEKFEKYDIKININNSANTLEDNITKDKEEFYGDLVEFNPVTLEEKVLEKVYHRFNTAQRETLDLMYNTIYHDEIYNDIYDFDKTQKISFNEKNKTYANLAPEGYIYCPHYKIKINNFEDTFKQDYDILMQVNNAQLTNNENNETTLTFNTLVNYSIINGGIVTFIDTDYNCYKFRVMSYEYNKEKKNYLCVGVFEPANNQTLTIDKPLNDCLFFKHNMSIPEYAYMLPDTSGRHIWKDIQAPSSWFYTDELYTTPFTNGAFYHHTNITFPLRRQDPFRKYGMIIKDEYNNIINNYELPANEYDYSDVEQGTIGDISCF